MSNEITENGVSRRTVLKGAALGGIGLVGGGTLLTSCGSDEASGPVKFAIRSNQNPISLLARLSQLHTQLKQELKLRLNQPVIPAHSKMESHSIYKVLLMIASNGWQVGAQISALIKVY